MNPQQVKVYVQQERAKGTSDAQIYDAIKNKKANLPKSTSTPVSPQRGFWGEVLPTAFAVGGGILGGIAGAVGGPAGAVAGGIVGAGAGGALGEGIQQKIEQSTGQRSNLNPGQITATGAISAATQAIGVGTVKLAGIAAKPALAAAKPPMIGFLKWASGYSDDVIARALQRTEGAVETAKGGEPALDDIVRQTATNLSQHAKDSVAASRAKIAELSKGSSGGPGEPGTREALLQRGTQFVSNITQALRKEHNIGVDNEAQLLFDRATNVSRIVSGGDRSAIQSAFDTVQSLNKDTTIRNIDAVLERLIALRSKTPVGSPTGSETKAIIGQMMSSVRSFATSLGEVAPVYKQYVQFIDDNIPKRVMIEDAKELFGGSSNLSPKEVSQISTRLLQLFNSGRAALREGVEGIGLTVGTDPVGGAASVLTKGFNVSQRAPNLSTRGLFERVIEHIPRTALQNYIKTGKLTGELLENNKVQALATLLGITTKAALQEIANLSADKTSN